MSRIDEAVELFRSGCACSQAILSVYCRPLGLDRALAMRLAAGFAGGMRLGETCGAVTGAFMVLGLRHCGPDCEAPHGRGDVYAAVEDFAASFLTRHGSLACRDLLGCDISTPEGMRTAKKQALFETKCPTMVREAAEILEEME